MNVTFKKLKEKAWERDKIFHVDIRLRIQRTLGIIAAKFLLLTPLTANQVTLISAITTVIAAAFLIKLNVYTILASMFFFGLSEVLDSADGLIARCKKQVSKIIPEFLCKIYHTISFSFIFLGLGIGMYYLMNDILYLFLGISATVFQLTTVVLLFLRQKVLIESVDLIKQKNNYKKIFGKVEATERCPSEIGMKNKKEVLILKVFVWPLKHLLEILLVFEIVFIAGYNFFNYFLFFYGIFIPIRMVLFFISTYRILQKAES